MLHLGHPLVAQSQGKGAQVSSRLLRTLSPLLGNNVLSGPPRPPPTAVTAIASLVPPLSTTHVYSIPPSFPPLHCIFVYGSGIANCSVSRSIFFFAVYFFDQANLPANIHCNESSVRFRVSEYCQFWSITRIHLGYPSVAQRESG